MSDKKQSGGYSNLQEERSPVDSTPTDDEAKREPSRFFGRA